MTDTKPAPVFPNVRCDDHPGPDEPGYVVCVHVVRGAAVAHFEPATDKNLGTVLCGSCWELLRIEHTRDDLPLILSCAHGVRNSGWDSPGPRRIQ